MMPPLAVLSYLVSRIHDKYIRPGCLCSLQGIKGDGSCVAAVLLGDNPDSGPVSPHFELFDGSGTESVRCGKDDLFPFFRPP
jgi:hypothetical protein